MPQTASLSPIEMNPAPVVDSAFRFLVPESPHLVLAPRVPISILRI
jgi:hypothetical protein